MPVLEGRQAGFCGEASVTASDSSYRGAHGRLTWLAMDAVLRELRSMYHSLLTRLSSLFRVRIAAQSHFVEACQDVTTLALLFCVNHSGSLQRLRTPACGACIQKLGWRILP